MSMVSAVLRFPGMTPQQLVRAYHYCMLREEPGLNNLSHAELAERLLREHGLLGWRIFFDPSGDAFSLAIWESASALKAVFNRETLQDPESPGAIVWADTQRMCLDVQQLGFFGVDFRPTGCRVLDGQNLLRRDDLPPEDELPRFDPVI